MSQLNDINFNDVLILNCNPDSYDFNTCLAEGEHNVIGFCTRCEAKGCNICPSDTSYKLQNISHGASSKDIFQATGVKNIPENWRTDGVLFLMEGPSIDYKIYKKIEYNGIIKNHQRIGIGFIISRMPIFTQMNSRVLDTEVYLIVLSTRFNLAMLT